MTRLVGLCWLVFWGLLVGGLACCCYGVPYGHAAGLFGVLVVWLLGWLLGWLFSGYSVLVGVSELLCV